MADFAPLRLGAAIQGMKRLVASGAKEPSSEAAVGAVRALVGARGPLSGLAGPAVAWIVGKKTHGLSI